MKLIILISIQYNKWAALVLAWLTTATVELEEVEGNFASRKKRVVKSTKVNMAEGPSTNATPSNQFVVKCSVHECVYEHIWSPCVSEPFEAFCKEDNEHDKYAMAVGLHLSNHLTVVGHIPSKITCTCHFW